MRGYTKWDDQPASPVAAREAVLRAGWIANTAPRGPTYVNLDAEMQEAKLPEPVPPIDAKRYMPAVASAAPAETDQESRRPACAPPSTRCILAGRVSRDLDAWNARVALAERLDARVVTDLKVGAAFPTDHPLHAGAPGGSVLAPEAADAIRAADVILSLDWVDLAGTFKRLGGNVAAKIIQVSRRSPSAQWLEHGLSGPAAGRSADRLPSRMPRCRLCSQRSGRAVRARCRQSRRSFPSLPPTSSPSIIWPMRCAARSATAPPRSPICSLSWNGASWPFRHPLDYLGSDGGGGVGGGPGISVGAALALKGSGRLPVAVCGDGDFLMGVTALWTAAHYRIPLLIVVANNRSFFNDELHQERVARMRNRPVENRWVGQRISEPDIDLAGMARAQGAQGFGPVTDDRRSRADVRRRPSPRSKPARWRSSMCGWNRATLPP